MKRAVLLVACAFAAGCSAHAKTLTKPARNSTVPIVVTSRMDGSVSIVDRTTLELVRTIPAAEPGKGSTWPMLALADAGPKVFYVANVNGSLARVPFGEGPMTSLDVGGPVGGLALSPDGKRLAVSGVKDLVVRFVDVATWKETARATLGDAKDAPKRASLTYGSASPHPVWLHDGSGVLVADNVHEELVIVAPDGAIKARRAMRSAVHAVTLAKDGTVLALAEGASDGSVPPHVAVLTPALDPVREVDVPLAPGETPKLHHGALSPSGELLVVANMGSVAAGDGVSVAAIRWRAGEVAWARPVLASAAHVAFLDPARVVVAGHRSAEMKVLDAESGKDVATWEILGTASLGHALEVEPEGGVLLLDGTLGRVLRFRNGELSGESPRVGDGYAESSLAE